MIHADEARERLRVKREQSYSDVLQSERFEFVMVELDQRVMEAIEARQDSFVFYVREGDQELLGAIQYSLELEGYHWSMSSMRVSSDMHVNAVVQNGALVVSFGGHSDRN